MNKVEKFCREKRQLRRYIREMQLSKRLQYVSDFITPEYVLADIGTDHGFIPIHQVSDKGTPKAYAMDINKGPLERADEHIAEAGLIDKIETRLSDGMGELYAGEAESILIAGMGGALMVKILNEGTHALVTAKELILSPHTEADMVRCFIKNSDFVIDREGMVCDAGKYYVVLHARRALEGEKTKMYVDDEEQLADDMLSEQRQAYIRFGKLLIHEKSEVFIEFLNKERNTYKNILERLKNNTTEEGIKRRQEVKQLIKIISLAIDM